MGFVFKLEEVLTELGATRNELAVESKTRPASLLEMYRGNTKRIELATMEKILDTLNDFAAAKGIGKTYTLDSIIKYERDAR
ncbi:helix-turn-helix domain-containing protein [Indiicoccus explosivorum]|uniref:helix-turn-helix domain-containing protein n=1 Tax=Indiicoccus explosivorum TaxID=1917864 RepID=UPI000B435AFE|nr:helix-turn-helix domain-containing protein [Indiicoccus explosivorum]